MVRREADVCVVGAGIVGLAFAFEALARGLSVVVVERDHHATGASVRNFGHGFVSAVEDGEPLRCALATRERWLQLAPRAGLEVLDAGSLIVARHHDEIDVMESFCSDERRQARMLGRRELAKLAPIPTDNLLGGLHCPLDVRVDPRTAVSRLAALLERDARAEILWAAFVHTIEPGAVQSTRGSVSAPLVFVCPGPGFDTLPPPFDRVRDGLRQCVLQMLRVGAPDGRHYRPALLTGLSLLRYPAFLAQPGIDRVRVRLELDRPELIEAGIHLIVTQVPDGDLLVGDTHAYGRTASPFREERLDHLLLREAAGLIGATRMRVRERWLGVYPVARDAPFLVAEEMPGVHFVEVVAGVGMTTAFGLAARVFDGLAGGPASS